MGRWNGHTDHKHTNKQQQRCTAATCTHLPNTHPNSPFCHLSAGKPEDERENDLERMGNETLTTNTPVVLLVVQCAGTKNWIRKYLSCYAQLFNACCQQKRLRVKTCIETQQSSDELHMKMSFAAEYLACALNKIKKMRGIMES